jgi:hypothetical protein
MGKFNVQRSNKFNVGNLKKGIIAQEYRNAVESSYKHYLTLRIRKWKLLGKILNKQYVKHRITF